MPLSASIRTRLEHQHKTLDELIKGLDEAPLRKRTNPDKWSVFENIAHLASYQPVFIHRIHQVEQLTNPGFDRYVADNDPAFHDCLRRSKKELLDDIDAQRFIIFNHLNRLGETALRRTAVHPKFGEMNLSRWTEFFLLHEAHHLFTIFQLVADTRRMLQQ